MGEPFQNEGLQEQQECCSGWVQEIYLIRTRITTITARIKGEKVVLNFIHNWLNPRKKKKTFQKDVTNLDIDKKYDTNNSAGHNVCDQLY